MDACKQSSSISVYGIKLFSVYSTHKTTQKLSSSFEAEAPLVNPKKMLGVVSLFHHWGEGSLKGSHLTLRLANICNPLSAVC